MSVFGPAFPPHGGVVLSAQWATHGGLLPVHGGVDPTYTPAPSFDPNFEYMPDTGWDNPELWTCTGGSDVNSTVPSGLYIPNRLTLTVGTALAAFAPGTYRYKDRIIATNGAPATGSTISLAVGGTSVFIPTVTKASVPQDVQVDIVITTATDQLIKIGGGSTSRWYPTYDGGSLKRLS